MSLAQLSLIPDAAPMVSFDGETFDGKQDGARLSSQLVATRELMLDGEWRNLAQIALALRKQGIHVTEASLSARLRDLRKPKFGSYTVQRQRLVGGLWEYRIELISLDPKRGIPLLYGHDPSQHIGTATEEQLAPLAAAVQA